MRRFRQRLPLWHVLQVCHFLQLSHRLTLEPLYYGVTPQLNGQSH
jgi:hypothetical protein